MRDYREGYAKAVSEDLPEGHPRTSKDFEEDPAWQELQEGEQVQPGDMMTTMSHMVVQARTTFDVPAKRDTFSTRYFRKREAIPA